MADQSPSSLTSPPRVLTCHDIADDTTDIGIGLTDIADDTSNIAIGITDITDDTTDTLNSPLT